MEDGEIEPSNNNGMTIVETERLILREVDAATDAAFMFELLNAPKFLKYIGDRGVRSVGEAASFIEDKYRQSYRVNGFGLYTVELKDTAVQVGICGFVKRDTLPSPDLGFAFLPEHERKGYGHESASNMLEYGRTKLDFDRVLAITSPGNEASELLLLKLGFVSKSPVDTAGERVNLFEIYLKKD